MGYTLRYLLVSRVGLQGLFPKLGKIFPRLFEEEDLRGRRVIPPSEASGETFRMCLHHPGKLRCSGQPISTRVSRTGYMFKLNGEGLQPIGPTYSFLFLVLRIVSKLPAQRPVIRVKLELAVSQAVPPVLRHSLVNR